jgi:hypothetical protein
MKEGEEGGEQGGGGGARGEGCRGAPMEGGLWGRCMRSSRSSLFPVRVPAVLCVRYEKKEGEKREEKKRKEGKEKKRKKGKNMENFLNLKISKNKR